MQQTYVNGFPRRMGVILSRDTDWHPKKSFVIHSVQAERDRLPIDATEDQMYCAADMAVKEVYSYIDIHKVKEYVLIAIGVLCRRHGIPVPLGATEEERLKRALDRNWWVRSIRKEHARRFEHVAIQLGFTSYKAGIYLSNESAARQRKRNADNAALLAKVELENEEGHRYTLAELSELGVSNKAIRRGELMTRIRGFEEIAQDLKHSGMFWTITAPSKYHAILSKSGDLNPKYCGATPRQAQAYLCKIWSRIRSALHKRGIQPYGFRIAEPHHDGCPHWHMLLFVAPEHAVMMETIIRKYALKEDGQEHGAKENRVKLVNIDAGKGTAAGYIAKYVAKNIDGAHVGDHKTSDGWTVTTDLLGNEEITPSQRVTYWSQLHGIRQFQQIGGAPVGVWRELRRVEFDSISRAPDSLRRAWRSVQRVGDALANFADFWRAGKSRCGKGFDIRIATRDVEVSGKYATYIHDRPCGVYCASNPAAVYESRRFQWKRVDGKAGHGVALDLPWTGVNNCTKKPAIPPWVSIKYDPKNKNFSSEVDEFIKNWKLRQ
ncbi:replication endonuclease [Undibacterium sp. Ji42W]|uniref:replication endonuclease n=1 Tax=Undibacterium sp. Ji42W TaxID=3413039 RepID=UPI003BF1EB2B